MVKNTCCPVCVSCFGLSKDDQLCVEFSANVFLCRKLGAARGEQLMANLPKERLRPENPPFTSVSVDYFGPLYIQQGHSHVKRYGCLFTCLTTRAVHIEITSTLDTDSFINALRRFISLRGNPSSVYSDHGSNFHAGEQLFN